MSATQSSMPSRAGSVFQAAEPVRARLRNPPVSRGEHLAVLQRIRLGATVEEMLKHATTS